MGNSTSNSNDGGEVPEGGANNNKKSGHSLAVNAALKVENTMSRSASGADVTEKYFTQLVPIEKLSEILKEKSLKQGVHGITSEVFVVGCDIIEYKKID